MTKKSQARLQRDATVARETRTKAAMTDMDKALAELRKLEGEDKTWEYNRQSYQVSRQGIDDLMRETASTIELSKHLLPFIDDATVFMSNLNTLVADTRMMREQLIKIYEQHATRDGAVVDGNELMFGLSVATLYENWVDKFNNLIIPVHTHVIDQLASAERDYNDAVAAAIASGEIPAPESRVPQFDVIEAEVATDTQVTTDKEQ